MGRFEDERTTISYCMGYAWQHYASFKSAMTVLGMSSGALPQRPLVIDIGCGPATAFVAIGEWLLESRRRRTNVRYVGIDRSKHFRELATAFAADPMLFEDFTPTVLPAAADFTLNQMATQMQDRDGAIILLSYVLHQDFMTTGDAVIDMMKNLSGARSPIWVLVQDANKPVRSEENVEEWPDTRLRSIINQVEVYGYRCSWFRSQLIEARRFEVDDSGLGVEQEAEGRAKTCVVAARLDRG